MVSETCMSKKTTSNVTATKEDMENIVKMLGGFATNSDLKPFATKDDMLELKVNMQNDVREMFEESERKHTKYHDRILNNLDRVVKELET